MQRKWGEILHLRLYGMWVLYFVRYRYCVVHDSGDEQQGSWTLFPSPRSSSLCSFGPTELTRSHTWFGSRDLPHVCELELHCIIWSGRLDPLTFLTQSRLSYRSSSLLFLVSTSEWRANILKYVLVPFLQLLICWQLMMVIRHIRQFITSPVKTASLHNLRSNRLKATLRILPLSLWLPHGYGRIPNVQPWDRFPSYQQS
jgi:hypothetical protein